tara:strand:+ start:3130 stop:4065 length:936 start_codon:yes stop_codon:yes gene_type:complete
MKFFLIILLFILFGCSDDEFINSELNNPEFMSFYESFKNEANIRGVKTENSQINFFLADIKNPNTAGLCYSNGNIYIDKSFWFNSSKNEKELLIYHELGHCVLNRNHKNLKSKSGECLSYLRGGEDNFECSFNLYSLFWRKYYLDELFNNSTILPNWYRDNIKYQINYSNLKKIVDVKNLESNSYKSTLDFPNTEKFTIEITFKDWKLYSANIENFSFRLNFSQYLFSISPETPLKIFIAGEPFQSYFRGYEFEGKKDLKMTVRKNNGLYQFFIDEQIVHIMESDLLKDDDSFEILFNDKIKMDILVFEFE